MRDHTDEPRPEVAAALNELREVTSPDELGRIAINLADEQFFSTAELAEHLEITNAGFRGMERRGMAPPRTMLKNMPLYDRKAVELWEAHRGRMGRGRMNPYSARALGLHDEGGNND